MNASAPSHAERRESRRARFPNLVVRITMGIHVPTAIAFTGGAELLHLPYPGVFGAGLAALLVVPFFGRMKSIMWDTPKTTFQRVVVDEPYFAHWCATLGAAVPITLISLFYPLIQLGRGLPPRLPTTAAFAIYASLFALSAYGIFIRRRWVQLNEIDVFVDDLPAALDGYRIAQLSDLHIGGHTPKERASKWVELANAQKPDLTVVTGDLVTSGTGFHDDIAETLAKLVAKDDVIVSMGNHDYFGEGDPLIEKMREKGLTVLRNESKVLTRNGAELTIAAADDTWTRRADVAKTLTGIDKSAKVVLLAHDPDLFDQAVAHGVDVMLSGHTHAGQIAFPFLVRQLNLSKLVHKNTAGIYRSGRTTQYVHAGLGTTGPPIRVGAAPEVAILTLRRR